MKNFFSCFILAIFIVSCGGGENENKMVVTGNVKGLKKGTLYLQYIPDSTLVTVDSIEVDGDGKFRFESILESPEIFYLYLDKEDKNEFNDRITFFGEPGTITINTSWNTFVSKAIIEGSESHKLMEEYNKVLSQFHSRSLELINVAADPEIQADSSALDSIQKLSDKVIVRRSFYTLTYAKNNANSYLSPYLALSEVENANPNYLDSIYISLSPEVADSKYGKMLKKYIEGSATAENLPD